MSSLAMPWACSRAGQGPCRHLPERGHHARKWAASSAGKAALSHFKAFRRSVPYPSLYLHAARWPVWLFGRHHRHNPGATSQYEEVGVNLPSVSLGGGAAVWNVVMRVQNCEHPQGVQPWGNFLLSGRQHIRSAGLGILKDLDDQLVLQILQLLDARTLAICSAVSKALYCFCMHDELWRALTLQELEGRFRYRGSWRETYLTSTGLAAADKQRFMSLRVQNLFSDLLFQPWYCATVPISLEWLERDTLERRSHLSAEDFRRLFELPNKPVVITDQASSWPARKKWTRAYLKEAFKGQDVVAGNYRMAFEDYLAYTDASCDDMPLYLFDSKFAQKAPQMAADYKVPEQFLEDLFSVLGESGRPDYRWLIMGPERSGSSFHKDPNATSAWNAVVKGSKKWVLFPPHVTPPGVHASADGAEVATPVSLVEWFLNFYTAAQEGDVKPVEGVVRAGEVLFVPRGWWHLAMNLEDSIAVTQNFVSSVGLRQCLAFLKTGNPDLVSGCLQHERTDLHQRFLAALQKHRPEVYNAASRSVCQAQRSKGLSGLFSRAAGTGQGRAPDGVAADERLSKRQKAAPEERGGFRFGF